MLCDHRILNCVNNKMLEHDWLLTALIYALIGSFRSKLSDMTCPISNIWQTFLAGTGSGGISDTGSVKALGAGSDTFGLFPFPSGAAATGAYLETSGHTSGTTFVAGFSFGLR